jgi:phage terminase large subunit-like protein
MVDPNVSYNKVHASRGKVIRAEPVAALYEQGRIHHVGAFPTLEDQQCAFTTDFDRKAAQAATPPARRQRRRPSAHGPEPVQLP